MSYTVIGAVATYGSLLLAVVGIVRFFQAETALTPRAVVRARAKFQAKEQESQSVILVKTSTPEKVFTTTDVVDVLKAVKAARKERWGAEGNEKRGVMADPAVPPTKNRVTHGRYRIVPAEKQSLAPEREPPEN